jgi:phytoene synthase
MADGSSPQGGHSDATDVLNSNLAYCLDALRQEDRDRYLILLFAPRGFRPVLAALYAFNLECARAVTAGGEQPILGQMRLQWWRDSLEAGAQSGAQSDTQSDTLKGSAHPVLSLLAGRRDLLPGLLDILAARERDLTDPPFANLAEVVVHAQATGGALAALAAVAVRALGGEGANDGSLVAARAAGTAYALAGMLRAIPYQAHQASGRHFQGRLCLPGDLLAQHGLTADDVWSGQKRAAVAGCVAEVAAVGSREVDKLSGLGRAGGSLSPLLHGSLARGYLNRLKKAGYDPFAPGLGLNPLARPLMLCWRSLLRRP